jgi:hypothetical protein
VNAKRNQLFPPKAVKRVRLLAALLLASIAWGATAEFTHTHGLRTQSTLTPAPISNSSFDTSESIQTTNQSSTSSRSRASAECLICQLHQNLSTTLLGHALATASVETHSFAFNPDLTLHRADFSKSQRGRAPPVNL